VFPPVLLIFIWLLVISHQFADVRVIPFGLAMIYFCFLYFCLWDRLNVFGPNLEFCTLAPPTPPQTFVIYGQVSWKNSDKLFDA
jgi:hypothetical protein